MASTPAGPHPFLFRAGKFLPFLLAVLSLFLIAGTCCVIFFQLSQIQEAVREMTGQMISGLAARRIDFINLQISYPGSEIGVVMLPASIACFACWLLLIYRLAWDARRLGGTRMQASPAQCVLSFILPVGNLWMPLKSLLNINGILSPSNRGRTVGTVLIWTAWTISVPVALLTFLYTFIHPFVTFMDTFREWDEQTEPFYMETAAQDIQVFLNSLVEPVLFYNGIVFILSLMASTLMLLYLDVRHRRMPPADH